jgi:hypothetical protein
VRNCHCDPPGGCLSWRPFSFLLLDQRQRHPAMAFGDAADDALTAWFA